MEKNNKSRESSFENKNINFGGVLVAGGNKTTTTTTTTTAAAAAAAGAPRSTLAAENLICSSSSTSISYAHKNTKHKKLKKSINDVTTGFRNNDGYNDDNDDDDDDDDDDDNDDNNMTASYTEIAFQSNYLLNNQKLKKQNPVDRKNNLRKNSDTGSGSTTKSSNDDDDDDDDDDDGYDDDDNNSDDNSDIVMEGSGGGGGGGGGGGDNGGEGGAVVVAATAADSEDVSKIFDNEKFNNDEKNKKLILKNQKKKFTPTKRPISLICDNSFPYNLEGIVSKDGDMTNFVAENLEYKIKLSSPVTKKEYPGLSSSRNSTPSTSGLISRQFLLPQQLPQIDSNVLNDIEIEAQYLAASVDSLTENLCNLLHSISSITADNVEIHKNAVNKLTDCMDANIKSMYTIMAKTEEISKSMKPTEQLAQRIREIKRLVEMLESNL